MFVDCAPHRRRLFFRAAASAAQIHTGDHARSLSCKIYAAINFERHPILRQKEAPPHDITDIFFSLSGYLLRKLCHVCVATEAARRRFTPLHDGVFERLQGWEIL